MDNQLPALFYCVYLTSGMIARCVVALLFATLISFLDAFATELIGNHCTKPMDVGTVMMGKPTELNETYSIQLFRPDITEVINGGMATRNILLNFNEI